MLAPVVLPGNRGAAYRAVATLAATLRFLAMANPVHVRIIRALIGGYDAASSAQKFAMTLRARFVRAGPSSKEAGADLHRRCLGSECES